MRMTYVVHIAAGILTVVFGYLVLYAPKGARLHRKSGRLFVHAMLTTAVFGATIAAARGVAPAIIPKPIRILPVLALPVLAVLVTMFYWLWRIRIRRSLRGVVLATPIPERP
jgi:uncharacterized membrane protein